MAGEPSQPTQPEEVLRTFSGRLFTAIRSPETLAQFLFAERLIGDDLLDDLPSMKFGEAKSKLLSSVRAAVRTSNRKENVMTRFLLCLEQSGEPSLGELATEIRAVCPGLNVRPSHSPSPERPRLGCEATCSSPPSHAVAYKIHAAQDTATQQPAIRSSLSLATNLPFSFVTHSFLYPSPVTDAHVMYTHPQSSPPPHTPHITSAIPSHQPIAPQQQPHLSNERTLFQNDASRLQQAQETTSPLPFEVSTYIEYLKGRYNRKRFPTYFKDSIVQVRAKDFIKVEIIHNEKVLGTLDIEEAQQLHFMGKIKQLHETRKSLNLDDFCSKLGTEFTSVLVEGVPGVGKTTFAWELCWQWKEGKLLNQFDLVLLAQIRTEEMRKAVTLHDIVYHSSKSVYEALVEYLQLTNGKRVLIIIEGYDEASQQQLSSDSIFPRILEGKELSYATVLVTSRPTASHALPEAFCEDSNLQRFEIIGFTENEIEGYIESALKIYPDILTSFKSYLDSNPLPRSLMCIPLHCAIMTSLYAKHCLDGKRDFAPKTMTQLYTALLMSLLLRYLSETSIHEKERVKVTKFSELPTDVYKKLMDLAKTAAEGIEQRRYTFTNLPDDTMGLTWKMEEFYSNIGSGVVTQAFLHLTLQEYLAALYWAETSPHQLQELLSRKDLFPINQLVTTGIEEERISSGSEYHWPVLLFLGGLTKLHQVEAEFLKSNLVKKFHPSFSQLLYEAQNPPLVKSVFANGEFVVRGRPRTNAMHWYVYGYCIAYSSSTASWRIEMISVSEKSLGLFKKGLKLCQRGCITTVVTLDMETSLTLVEIVNSYSHNIKRLLFFNTHVHVAQAHTTKFATCFPSLQQLCIKGCDLNEWLPFLASISHFSALEHLYLRTNCKVTGSCLPQCVPSLKILRTNVYLPFIVESNISTLDTLHIDAFHGNSDMIALSHAVQSPNCHVKKLVVHMYTEQIFPVSEVELLQAVAKCNSLCTLDYGIANPSHDVFAALAHLIKHHTTLSEVVVREPGDSIEGVLLLVEAIKDSNIAHLRLHFPTHKISEGRWMEVMNEHAFPRDRITLKF